MPNLIRKALLLVWIILLLMLSLENSKSYAQAQQIQKIVIDKKSGKPIPFASIGVKNKPIGTVADSLGRFNLFRNYTGIVDTDSVFFSSIGYQRFKTTWGFIKQHSGNIFLIPGVSELSTVNIYAPKAVVKTFGKGFARIMVAPKYYGNMPQQSDEKGREQASVFNIDRDILLRTLRVDIMSHKEKSITFRMNIYSVKNGRPEESILTKNVIFTIQGPRKIGSSFQSIQPVDLTPYKIRLKGYKEIALGIEIIDRELAAGDTTNTAFYVPSYPTPLKHSFYRLKSQAQWEKVGSSYLIASLDATVLKKGDVKEIPDDDNRVIQSLSKIYGKKMMYGNSQKASNKVKLKDADIYYEIYGKGEPLLLLHGNNGGISSFSEQIGPLSKHFKVIAVDTRGQGNSTNNLQDKYTYELFAADMKQLLDSLNLKKVNVLGWSDGGNTGLLMAIHHKGYINKLAVMGSNAFSGETAVDPHILKIFEERSRLNAKKTDAHSVNQKRLADLVLTEPNISTQELQTIKAPTLVMAGENDAIKKEHTVFLHENIRNSKLVILKGADHDAPLKSSRLFNRLVISFFREN